MGGGGLWERARRKLLCLRPAVRPARNATAWHRGYRQVCTAGGTAGFQVVPDAPRPGLFRPCV